ncbi:hypothetical protein ACA910_006186 [Epithemia clementina (nom. ined.)]
MSKQDQQQLQPQQERDSEFHNCTVFSPFVMLIERYARKRRAEVVRKRYQKRERYNSGDPLEIVNADGSVTRVISVVPIATSNVMS